jgi:CheY-like chemotaxis protein
VSKRILVVDDDPLIIKILGKRLLAEGYLVMAAADGPASLRTVASFRPDGIILDVMMPGMDGTEVADRLGLLSSTARIPIIFLSALIAPNHPQDSSTRPNHHYLGKPCEPEVLRGLMRRIGL